MSQRSKPAVPAGPDRASRLLYLAESGMFVIYFSKAKTHFTKRLQGAMNRASLISQPRGTTLLLFLVPNCEHRAPSKIKMGGGVVMGSFIGGGTSVQTRKSVQPRLIQTASGLCGFSARGVRPVQPSTPEQNRLRNLVAQ